MSGVLEPGRLHSYPKVWNLGHPAIADLFDGPVVVQEKVDGSQFTFGVIGGELHMRSKGAAIYPPVQDKLFRGAAETAERLFNAGLLVEGWQYRGEAMCGPKHNTKEYGRAPVGNVVLFDVDTGLEERVSDPGDLHEIAETLGMEVVPTFYTGTIADVGHLKSLLDTESMLGATRVEGVVIKNYARWGQDGKMLMGKIVSEEFRETHKRAWVKSNPSKGDVIERLRDAYRSERRWEKAVERMRDAGRLQDAPQDIGPLLKSVQADVEEECAAEIAEALLKAFLPDIKRGATAGLPEWYKARLLERQPFAATSGPESV